MTFDRKQLVQTLEALPHFHQAAFAASCCERLYPNYRAFCEWEQWEQAEALRTLLDTIWQILQQQSFTRSQLKQQLALCEELIPDMDHYESWLTGPALEAHRHDRILEQWVDASPLMQAELQKQQDDLALLGSCGELTGEVLERLRRSSEGMGIQPYRRRMVPNPSV